MALSLQKFIVHGQKKLQGTVTVSGSKNAALPILCAALLSNEPSRITNVPDIADIHTLLNIFQQLNVVTSFQNHTVTVDPSQLKLGAITEDSICSMRASILLLGPLLSRFPEVKLPFPGGCVLGKRSAFAHTEVFKAFGASVLNETELLHLAAKDLHATSLIMPEQSVTATENALMLAASLTGTTEIKLAATEPHVQDLCRFLVKMGATISGIGTPYLKVEGAGSLRALKAHPPGPHAQAMPAKKSGLHGTPKDPAGGLHGAAYEITGDYLEAGTFTIAALLTNGHVKIKGIQTHQLDSFWQKLNEVGANFRLLPDQIEILPGKNLQAANILKTAVYPGFATDLQAPFTVLLTQCIGESRIFETLFEGRLHYLVELEKMGAHVQILNPHQAIIKGPTTLKGVPIVSSDIRAGAAMVLAALCARGETKIANINYIDRGYEKIDQKLRQLGADIERVSV